MSLPSRKLRFALCTVSLSCFAGWAFWYNGHRRIGWADTFNPMYWVRRTRGEDLYDAEHEMLLHGNRNRNEVALTFDDGPHDGSRQSILATLKSAKVKATFFDVGKNISMHPDLVLQTLADGHEIGNHSTTHLRLNTLRGLALHREINNTDITYYRITGRHLTFLRPPGVRYDNAVFRETRRLGYVVVGYSAAAHDYALDESPSFVSSRTVDRAEPGSILLLHDYPETARALPDIIRILKSRGFGFVTCTEMLDHLPDRQHDEYQRFRNSLPPAPQAAAMPHPLPSPEN